MTTKMILTARRKSMIFANAFHITGSITGMKKLYYGKNALLVHCGSWIYNVSSEPEVYYNIAH
ncbi:hypothetical protein NXX56_23660 [Bacteroides thetaiotaomicron]|nr:hypothetical protein [Bacteroides thetaiotaomicron]